MQMEPRSLSFMFLNWLLELHEIYSSKIHATLEFIFVASKSPAKDTNSEDEKRTSLDEDHKKMLLRGDVEMVLEKLGFICKGENFEATLSTNGIETLFDENEPSIDEVKQAFHLYDENCDGYIDETELMKVLKRLGFVGFSERECRKMIAAYDFNRDGKIDFTEFFKLVEDSFC